ncbi:MAG: rhodanese-like domain-containing protein, partial [Clostridiales bacterium]|nr:rhodanese-like domain-containing protein [Clostridiales bacterium]
KVASSPPANSYIQISAEQAKTIMDEQEDYILLDVRTEGEFAEGYIEGAILIPDTEIKSRAEAEMPDKDALILVYCRSGNRSKRAAEALADMGYTNVQEFGGINDWPYEIVK